MSEIKWMDVTQYQKMEGRGLFHPDVQFFPKNVFFSDATGIYGNGSMCQQRKSLPKALLILFLGYNAVHYFITWVGGVS